MAQVDTLLRAVATKPYFLADDKTAECLEVFSSYFGTSLQCFCFENQASLPSCPNIHRTVQLTHSSCTCTTSTPNGAPCSASDFPNCRNILSNNWQLWLLSSKISISTYGIWRKPLQTWSLAEIGPHDGTALPRQSSADSSRSLGGCQEPLAWGNGRYLLSPASPLTLSRHVDMHTGICKESCSINRQWIVAA